MGDIHQDLNYNGRAQRPDARLVVACDAAGCDHAILMDPQPVFGARRFWPVVGRSERFRCRCGSRETILSYSLDIARHDDPMSKDAIRLWT